MVLSSDFTKMFRSCVQTFLNKNLFLALVSICIRFWMRLSVMLIISVSKLFLFIKTVFLMLYLANLMMIDLDWLQFLSFPIRWLQSISASESFYCKSSFKVSVMHHQKAIPTSMRVSRLRLYLNHKCFIRLSYLFFHLIDLLLFLSVNSLQLVKLFIVKFYWFGKVSLFTLLCCVTWLVWQVLFILASIFFIQLTRQVTLNLQ